jgi:hypothetical protein
VTNPVPAPIAPKSSTFTDGVASATSFSDLQRYFQPIILRISKHSPPVLNLDITEGQLLWDRTAKRLYTVSDGVLRYAAFT